MKFALKTSFSLFFLFITTSAISAQSGLLPAPSFADEIIIQQYYNQVNTLLLEKNPHEWFILRYWVLPFDSEEYFLGVLRQDPSYFDESNKDVNDRYRIIYRMAGESIRDSNWTEEVETRQIEASIGKRSATVLVLLLRCAISTASFPVQINFYTAPFYRAHHYFSDDYVGNRTVLVSPIPTRQERELVELFERIRLLVVETDAINFDDKEIETIESLAHEFYQLIPDKRISFSEVKESVNNALFFKP